MFDNDYKDDLFEVRKVLDKISLDGSDDALSEFSNIYRRFIFTLGSRRALFFLDRADNMGLRMLKEALNV